MLFNSQIFIFIFLPLVLAGWYILNHFKKYNIALAFLVGMSLWFYGYFNPSYLLIILSSIAVNYLISFLIKKFEKTKKLWFILGLLFNIGILGYYKYFDFMVGNINAVFKTDFALKHILLPLGISFFTLQQISYITDRYWGSAEHYNILYYMAYVAYFPQLIAGPIVLHNEIVPQFMDMGKRRFNSESFADGIVLFVLGLGKKMLLADTFALFVNEGFNKIVWIDTPSAWLVSACYAVELYFDFSGYCDMACGIAKMINFDLPVNFKSPLKTYSVNEYWSRWHITLTRFFTTYIYNPITMSAIRHGKKTKKLFRNITPMIIFLISGIWHGASWTFVIWGLAEGLGTVWSQRKKFKLKKAWYTWLANMLFVVITSAIFRSENWDNMVRMLKAMFVPKFGTMTVELCLPFANVPEFYAIIRAVEVLCPQFINWIYIILLALLWLIAVLILRGRNAQEILQHQKEKGLNMKFTLLLSAIFIWCIISLNQVSTFLYFNF